MLMKKEQYKKAEDTSQTSYNCAPGTQKNPTQTELNLFGPPEEDDRVTSCPAAAMLCGTTVRRRYHNSDREQSHAARCCVGHLAEPLQVGCTHPTSIYLVPRMTTGELLTSLDTRIPLSALALRDRPRPLLLVRCSHPSAL